MATLRRLTILVTVLGAPLWMGALGAVPAACVDGTEPWCRPGKAAPAARPVSSVHQVEISPLPPILQPRPTPTRGPGGGGSDGGGGGGGSGDRSRPSGGRQTDSARSSANLALREGCGGSPGPSVGLLGPSLGSAGSLPDLPGMAGPQSTRKLLGILSKSTRRLTMRLALLTISGPFPVAGPAWWSNDWHAPRYCPYPHSHKGLDIFARTGTPVVAVADGRISQRMNSPSAAGLAVELTDARRVQYFYAHLSRFAKGIRIGKRVRQGDVLGYVGNTGNARGTSPHLHFEIQPGGVPVPPKPYVDRWLLLSEARAKVLVTAIRLKAPITPKSLNVRLDALNVVDTAALASLEPEAPPPPRAAPYAGPTLPFVTILPAAMLMLMLGVRRSARRNGAAEPVLAG